MFPELDDWSEDNIAVDDPGGDMMGLMLVLLLITLVVALAVASVSGCRL